MTRKRGKSELRMVVEAELAYVQPMIVSCVLLMGIPAIMYFLIPFLTGRLHGGEMLRDVSYAYATLIASLAVCFVMLVLEIKESRIRQIALLPISRSGLGRARIIAPIFVWLLFLLLHFAWEMLIIAGAQIRHAGLDSYVPMEIWGEFIGRILSIQMLAWLGWWLLVIFLLRLFTEWQGRVALGAIAVAIVWNMGSPVSSHRWSHLLRNLSLSGIQAAGPAAILLTYIPWIITGLAILMIAVFFSARKSFLE